jgi:hypothetical protein
MYDILFWWLVLGMIGASMIFYEDLRDRLKWGDAEIDLGEIVVYFAMSCLGPFMFFLAIRETKFLEILLELFGEVVSRLSDIKVYTFKKHGE